MNRIIKNLCIAVLIACLACTMISGCSESHTHMWIKATCTEPKTCKICGKTEGEAKGHTPGDAEYYEHSDGTVIMTHCTVCGKVSSKEFISNNSKTYYGDIHYCEECSNIGTHSMVGISGYIEHYCDYHYNEIIRMYSDMADSTTP